MAEGYTDIEYGLLGEKLGHSWSVPIHNMLADYRYELYAVTRDQMASILTGRRFRGLNVTIPYKRDVMAYCDEISDEARSIGSVNTLVMGDDGRLRGYNTDLYGFLSMARRGGVDLKDKKVAILGTGGTSLTAQAACARAGAREVVVVSRSGPVDYLSLRRDHADAQVIVNTTPVGMYPGNGVSAVELSDFPACEGVIDVIYNPLRTKLMLDAAAKGIPCVSGLWMLVAQAKRAAELFTGAAIDDEEIGRVYRALRGDMANLVLIGMPGCGKSTVGRALAEAMGRRFVDLDAEIERAAGVPIPEIFARQGEGAFRDIECEQAARVGSDKALVIAAGGGAVKRGDTMRSLIQNGEAIWLRRPVERLALSGRPLSKDIETVKRMEVERAPLYQAWSAAAVDNDGDVDQAVRRVREVFYEAADR